MPGYYIIRHALALESTTAHTYTHTYIYRQTGKTALFNSSPDFNILFRDHICSAYIYIFQNTHIKHNSGNENRPLCR